MIWTELNCRGERSLDLHRSKSNLISEVGVETGAVDAGAVDTIILVEQVLDPNQEIRLYTSLSSTEGLRQQVLDDLS